MRGASGDVERAAGVASAQSSPTAVPWWRRGRRLSDGTTLHWWKQLIAVLAVYLLYELVRNKTVSGPSAAFHNALSVLRWQEALHLNFELDIQSWSLDWVPLIVFSNYFYGSAYIFVTIGIIIWLYRRRSDAYPLWRNTLAIMTTLGLVGFALFPLTPPRLLYDYSTLPGIRFGFVDTLVNYPTFWSFDSGAMRTMSNPFAAMPSLHCAWAIWAAFTLSPRVRPTWAKVLAVVYPIVTVYVVVATGNHYLLDAVGGLVIFLAGYLVARLVTRAGRRRPVLERVDDAVVQQQSDDEVAQPYRSIAVR